MDTADMQNASKSLFPDPSEDLDWGGFDRPIHEILDANAKQHPNKICVIETDVLKPREFTYQQINEASNILAQHLVLEGVERDEVVMIYAYRGVDLVVAIMGVLKAGATFSVIDPQYPADRQIIYLDVARPRALVILKKATETAGRLSTNVSAWIAENLMLRTSVPELLLQDDGRLTGGSVNGNDVLEVSQSLKDRLPGVIVGPDSTPTLSFTSGSEGRPKGVRGRHYSLVYYFPWMAERFGLSQNDKFTMLSGIAHDPIQRDIFTPLFLGAQILVPSREDIQHEKLAEWMKTYGATVTHLTPAMGQILVGGATAEFPKLRNAFFVGDVLIKRDVRRLQTLAPNVRVINMFGTTETQRAVSYYAIPARSEDPEHLNHVGDVIPAGRGMKNVQLLVVDRENRHRICGVGEIGEIYVRAAGLAEGYLMLPELTHEKFVDNWFGNARKWMEEYQKSSCEANHQRPWQKYYKGPRDRLYRSGDLGRYMPSGDVECTGRADNQVKIRGFRIELGEIDSHLSAHPLIRENVTLVRRDKDEEQTLVSYIVPELSRWPQFLEEKGLSDELHEPSMVGMLKRFRVLREDLRSYLKTKLPAYAVPSVIVPLSRMPVNPNGKVDKPALPFPEASEMAAAAAQRPSITVERTPTEQQVAEIWANLLENADTQTISPDDSFFELGGHSLIAQKMFSQVRKTWNGIDVSITSIHDYPTLRAFSAEIDRALDPQGRRLDIQGQNDGAGVQQAKHYSLIARGLVQKLPDRIPHRQLHSSEPAVVFLTGATGFLGAYVLRDLLDRTQNIKKVFAHVRVKHGEDPLDRIRQTCTAFGIWHEPWTSRIECVTGDLGQDRIGLSEENWTRLASEVDIVIHNGAVVHWIKSYHELEKANVQSTLAAIDLASIGKPKQVNFVSSTSVLETEHYLQLSENGTAISEDDDLSGSERGLSNGYGQTKWVSEYLMREAGKRGLSGSIVRPSYVVGDSSSGVSITDDFLIRMLKGCIQLSCRPDLGQNSINMVCVDQVACTVVAVALNPPKSPGVGVAHVTCHPLVPWRHFLDCLEVYGYNVPQVEYPIWKDLLEAYVVNNGDHALLPLLHYVTSDLPAQAKAVKLEDKRAQNSLRLDAESYAPLKMATGKAMRDDVAQELLGLLLGYLVAIGFIPAPSSPQRRGLPVVTVGQKQREALGRLHGRGTNPGLQNDSSG